MNRSLVWAVLLTSANAFAKTAHTRATETSDDGAGTCIAFLVIIPLIAFFIYRVAKSGGGGASTLLTTGVLARGILLRVDIPLTRWSAEGVRQTWQNRRLRIDVEVPGKAPYEIDTWVSFPTNLNKLILPGATVELRVDPKNPQKVIVSGPGVALGASFFNPNLQWAPPAVKR